MTIGERIKKRRLELNISVDELAKKLSKNRATVYRYESNDIENLPISILEPLSRALITTPAYLMGWEENNPAFLNLFPLKLKKVPLLGEIACGTPTFAVEDKESYIMAENDINADFCLIAKGNSMVNARIFDGDKVFIRSQPDVETGEIAVVLINDEAVLKRVFKKEDSLILMSENPEYPPLIYRNEELCEIKILGKAVTFQSDVK